MCVLEPCAVADTGRFLFMWYREVRMTFWEQEKPTIITFIIIETLCIMGIYLTMGW